MNRKIKLFVGIWVLAAVGLAACQLPFVSVGTDTSAVATQSAKLIQAGRATETAKAMATGIIPLPIADTITPEPTQLLAYTATPTSVGVLAATPTTLLVTATQFHLPTATQRPTSTPLPPPPTATAIPCDMASFVKDLSVPDGSIFSPGTKFTKTWRLLNAGTCTWTTSYAIVFDNGTQLGGSSPVNLSASVAPGKTVDVSVVLTAPSVEGKYRSSWKLRNAAGLVFGTGVKAGGSAFYAEVVVRKVTTNYALDFVEGVCGADWSSDAGTLTCPSPSDSSSGYVQRVDAPLLENGATDNEPALLTVPQAVNDGVIKGKYGWYTVQNGDTFRSVLGCTQDAKNCSVKFSLLYMFENDTNVYTEGNWTKSWDGKINSVALDLSNLAGKKVRFILSVSANGEMRDDRAMWLAPRIIHK